MLKCIFIVVLIVISCILLKKYIDNVSLESFCKTIDTMQVQSKLNYPVYYINMDKDVERRDTIEKELNRINADFFRVKGFNGYKIKDNTHDIVEGVEFFNSYTHLKNGEIGCLVSHLCAIENAWNNGEDIALICEDDAKFHISLLPDFSEIIYKAPKDWEILQLFSGYENNTYTGEKIEYTKREFKDWSCAAYLINRNGMEKILRVVKPDIYRNIFYIQQVKDGFPSRGEADYYLYDLANSYVVSPHFVIPDNSIHDSTIHSDHTPLHLNSSKNAYKNLYKFYKHSTQPLVIKSSGKSS